MSLRGRLAVVKTRYLVPMGLRSSVADEIEAESACGGEVEPWQRVKRLIQQLGEIQCLGGAPVIKPDAQQVLRCDLWVLLRAFEDAC